MKSKTLSITYTEYPSADALKPAYHKLLKQATVAAWRAYAPYSGFRVGAALLLDDDTIVTGNNQENAAYPSGLCAERVVLFNYGSQDVKNKITALAVVALDSENKLIGNVCPCGSCLQVMSEFEHRNQQPFDIIFTGTGNTILVFDSITRLLPFGFDSSKLI